ncbi:MAG: hypothetical protein ACPHUH_07800, partial [Porticoccaceae bacterium]
MVLGSAPVTRCEYVRVSSGPASLLATVTGAKPRTMPLISAVNWDSFLEERTRSCVTLGKAIANTADSSTATETKGVGFIALSVAVAIRDAGLESTGTLHMDVRVSRE